MDSVYNYIIKPKNSRYNNTKKVGKKDLILNTEISNHQFISREAVVKSIPKALETDIKPGDEVIVHHNVFRRWHDMRGEEKNSRSYFNEETYLVTDEQIFLYKNNNKWKSPSGYCFVKPIKAVDSFNVDSERPLIGIVKYSDGTVEEGDLIGFKPSSEFEFVIDGERLYRVLSHFITIKYEYQGDEEEYNPSWTQSSRGIN
tara:strand:- start:1416 stop:2018 length:603 start_codon:yes stop_codon:yes gene_type:complete